MFVGHYGVALAAKAVQPERSLGGLFVASQLMDVTFSVLLLAGVERVRIDPEGAGPAGVEIEFAAYSHGLVGVAVLAAATYAVTLLVLRGHRRRIAAAGLLAAVVLSHWPLDVLVHDRDIPLVDHSVELGTGLPVLFGFAIEVLLLVAGLVLYLRRTVPRTTAGRFGMPAFAVGLVAFGAYVATASTPATVAIVALSNLAVYAVFAAVAEWLDRRRTDVRHPDVGDR